jgi:AcrR family transcriptional regulator
MTAKQQASADAALEALWFSPPASPRVARRTLTREQVVSQALALVSAAGAQSLTMRGLADRLGVVPGALYRHVRSKEQLQDLVLDAVLADIDMRADRSLDWAGQVTALAGRLRAVLEDHPGIAGLLKSRDLISPNSLALAEAFLAPLHQGGLPARQAVLAYRLICDYTVGFAPRRPRHSRRAAAPGRPHQQPVAGIHAIPAGGPLPRASRHRRADLDQ